MTKSLQNLAAECDPAKKVNFKLRASCKGLNISRGSNVEAVIVSIVGNAQQPVYISCAKGNGPSTECRVVVGVGLGSCGNCMYSASGPRYSLRPDDSTRKQPERNATRKSNDDIQIVAESSKTPAQKKRKGKAAASTKITGTTTIAELMDYAGFSQKGRSKALRFMQALYLAMKEVDDEEDDD